MQSIHALAYKVEECDAGQRDLAKGSNEIMLPYQAFANAIANYFSGPRETI
jgi:hypothetical protein